MQKSVQAKEMLDRMKKIIASAAIMAIAIGTLSVGFHLNNQTELDPLSKLIAARDAAEAEYERAMSVAELEYEKSLDELLSTIDNETQIAMNAFGYETLTSEEAMGLIDEALAQH